MDVHTARCRLAVISEKGRKLKDFPVETNGQALVEAIRMIPGHKHLVMEEGLQSAWLYETLSPRVDELVVAGITQSRGPKTDKRDAYPTIATPPGPFQPVPQPRVSNESIPWISATTLLWRPGRPSADVEPEHSVAWKQPS
jgi:hypothetical protein